MKLQLISVNKTPVIFSIVATVWASFLVLANLIDTAPVRDLFTDSYFVIPLIAGLLGLYSLKLMQERRGMLGQILILTSVALILQAIGQIFYALHFRFYSDAVPYPSIGDVAFLGSNFALFVVAIKSIKFLDGGSHLRLAKPAVLISLLAVSILSTWVFVYFFVTKNGSQNSIVAIFLDYAYPAIQMTNLILMGIVVSQAGKLRKGWLFSGFRLLFIGLFALFVADLLYIYQASQGSWQAAGVSDFLFMVSYVLVGYDLLKILTKESELSD